MYVWLPLTLRCSLNSKYYSVLSGTSAPELLFLSPIMYLLLTLIISQRRASLPMEAATAGTVSVGKGQDYLLTGAGFRVCMLHSPACEPRIRK